MHFGKHYDGQAFLLLYRKTALWNKDLTSRRWFALKRINAEPPTARHCLRSAAVFDIMGDKMFKCREIKDRTDNLIEQLLGVWESSVRATHLFLSEQEIEGIKQYVPQALRGVPHLIIAEEDGAIAAFAGIDGRKIEMLFVAAKSRGRGIGRQLLQYAFDVYAVNELTVNEQNPQAIAFYEHMGFWVCKRSDIDEQGNAYPILYMKR